MIASTGRHKIGFTRTINGERCILQRYTANGRPQYRRPNGEVITLGKPRKYRRKSRRLRAPRMHAAVLVRIAGRPYRGYVYRRSPLVIKVTAKCPFRGLLLERPKYKLAKNKG